MKVYILTQDSYDGSSIIGVYKDIGRAEKEKVRLEIQKMRELTGLIDEAKKVKDRFWVKQYTRDLIQLQKNGRISGGDNYNVSGYDVK